MKTGEIILLIFFILSLTYFAIQYITYNDLQIFKSSQDEKASNSFVQMLIN